MDFTLDQQIGQMVMTGFRGDSPDAGLPIIQHIKKYHLGGVWLTDNDSPMQETIGNISSPKQVKSLTQNLQEYTNIPLFIAIEAVELAINAGVDIILNSNVMHYNANIAEITFQTIKDLVEKGRISKARINESFSRIMKLKRNLS